jgi:phage baseplate assembly protein gpV
MGIINMTRRLGNALRSQTAQMNGQIPTARYGTVQSVSPADCTVRVLLQPEAVLSGWLPVLMPALGSGWGLVALPSVQQQVLVLAEYGSADSGVVIGTAFSQRNPPPQVASAPGGAASHAQPGEALLVGSSGATIRLCADGSVFIAASTVNVQGNLVVQGDVSDRHGSLDRLRGHYDQHVHTGTQPGSGNTGITSQPDAE